MPEILAVRIGMVQRGAVRAAHAQLFDALAGRYAGRIPRRRMLQLYTQALQLDDADQAWLASRLAEHPRDAETEGMLRFRDWLRLHGAPHGDPTLRRRLDADLERCRRLMAGLEARRPRTIAAPERLLAAVCQRQMA
jgi:hypothetical protein